MFPKAILTSLAIGALSLSASAAPIAVRSPGIGSMIGSGRELPRSFSALSCRDPTFVSVVFGIVPTAVSLLSGLGSSFKREPESPDDIPTFLEGAPEPTSLVARDPEEFYP